MSYRYRRIDVRKGRVLWQARPVCIDVPEGDQAYAGLDMVPMGLAEKWWRGFTRQQAISRAYRWAKRQNRRDDRNGESESIWFGVRPPERGRPASKRSPAPIAGRNARIGAMTGTARASRSGSGSDLRSGGEP